MVALTPKDLKSLEQTLAKLQDQVRIVYFTEQVNCRHCRQERRLLAELADLSHKLELEVYNFTADRDVAREYGVDKVPGLVLVGQQDYGVRYYGMPSDFEFRMLLEDMVRVSSADSGLSPDSRKRLSGLNARTHLEVLTTPACPFSETAIRLAHQMAMESDRVTADLVNVEDFPELAEHYEVMAAPTVVVNERHSFYGALDESEFIEKALEGAREEDA